MAYTFGGLKKKLTASLFENLQRDSSNQAIQVGNYMQSQDATTVAVTSPASNVSASGAALTVPQGAQRFRINPSVTCQVGEDSSYAEGYLAPASVDTVFDCANQQYIYLKPSNGTNTIYFQFSIV